LIGVLFYINYKINSYIFIKCTFFTYFLYMSSKILVIFLHETGHAITALLYGVSLIEVRILSILQGVTLIEESSSSIIMSNLAISGGLGIVIILVLLLVGLLASRKDLKADIFIPVYIVTSLHLFEEIRYWYTSILKRFGDGWDFIELNPQIDCVNTLFIINSILWMATTILSLIFVYPFSKNFIRKLYINLHQRRLSENIQI